MRSGVIEGFQQAGANGTHLRTLTVELLTGESILITTEGKTTCSAIWNRVQGELVARGVIHPQIFGLAIKTGFDWVFVDPDAKVSKYFPKDWKTTPGSSSSINESKGLVLYCRVHFYLESLPTNFDVVSLLHYYLQLRQNLTTTVRRTTSSNNLLQSLAYALQSEAGDWTPCHEYPPPLRTLLEELPGVTMAMATANLRRAHQVLAGLGQGAARSAFIRSLIPTYNMHLYGMTLRTKDGKDTQAWIGVTPKGIEVYQNEPGRNEIPEQPKITFLWASITKLYFERKKFEIRGKAFSSTGSTSTEKLAFTSWSESLPRHLLLLCRSTHQFHLSNHRISVSFPPPTTNGSGGSDYRTGSSTASTGTSGTPSVVSGDGTSTILTHATKNDDKMLDLSLWADGLLLPNGKPSSEHQRVSVISNASSNTTSGIVSDRVYSLDGSEEDLELRISDCCTDRGTGTNNSTSLESLTHKTSKRHHRSLKPHHLDGLPKNGGNGALEGTPGEAEIKYWYCDSDCEDDCCDSGPCRSLLVNTINDGGHKHSCAAFCECNSCLADEDDFEIESSSGDSSSNHLPPQHHHTPSLASEKTLKAIDISLENENKMDDSKTLIPVESTNEDEATENVYGEISEVPKIALTPGGKYPHICPKKSEPKSKDTSKGILGSIDHRNVKHRSHCGQRNKQRGINEIKGTAITSAKEMSGLTPKVASLKYLRTQRVGPWINGRPKGYSKNNYLNSSMGSLDEASDGCYIEFDTALQQGRYPSTRTVSDNFDTDSDYVQLPPLHPRRPPPKRPTTCRLWKFVKGSAHHKSCENVVDEVDCGSHASALSTLPRRNPLDPKQVHQLRRDLEKISVNNSKMVSKSTNALNAATTLPEEIAPEPPPKPKKLSPASDFRTTKPVDARFITSKPQILIQTAYATPTNVAVPGQAQLLFRKSQVPMPPATSRRTQSQIVQPTMTHSLSLDNIYDTVATEEPMSTIIGPNGFKQLPPPPLAPKPASSSSSIIIRTNNYVDVHASSPARNNSKQKERVGSNLRPRPDFITSHQPKQALQKPPHFPQRKGPPPVLPPITGKNRSGSVPNNLHTFYVGLQNLKPLSRVPIVYPMATSNPALGLTPAPEGQTNQPMGSNQMIPSGTQQRPASSQAYAAERKSTNNMTLNGTLTTPTAGHSARSQIQQFKAQLYSDMDYVIFPPKDPRLSQQEYSDSKSLSLTTITSTISNPMLSNSTINDFPPPYLPPPPPYPFDPPSCTQPPQDLQRMRKPPRPLPGTPNQNPPVSAQLPPALQVQNSYTSIYASGMSSNLSQCSSSQYGGAYAMGTPSTVGSASTVGLNAENLQKFLSTQSLSGSQQHLSSPPLQIYYPASTHSAPPLPPYKNTNQVLIENGMRRAVQRLLAKSNLSSSDHRIRMKLLSRSEESLYSQPVEDAEEKLQAIYNLPPPPPYKKKPVPSPSEVDLTSLRQKCTALELPLLKALLNSSDGALKTNQQNPQQQQALNQSGQRSIWKQMAETPPAPARPPKPSKLRLQ